MGKSATRRHWGRSGFPRVPRKVLCACRTRGCGLRKTRTFYPLTVTLNQGRRATDSYSFDIGIRTVTVRGDQVLLNGQPIKLTGFGKYEDSPLTGRAQNLPMWIRDYELLRWVGANSYRTSRYPYSEEAMLLATGWGFWSSTRFPRSA